MSIPIQITVRDEESTQYLINHIKEKAAKLNQFSHDIVKCRIVVDAPHRNQLHGNLHAVHVELTVPRNEIVINKVEDKNIYVAVHSALDAARRQLSNFRKRRQLRRRP